MARAIGMLATVVALAAPLALCFEPFARYPEDLSGAWLGTLGLLPLMAFALWSARRWSSALALAHAGWLVGAYLAFSTSGEIWSGLQLLLCNASALVCVTLALVLRLTERGELTPERYGLLLTLTLGGVLATFGAARGAWDGARWALMHHEAGRLAAYARTHGDARGYVADVAWAEDALRHGPHECQDGSHGYAIRYSVTTPSTSHSITTCPGNDAWFYYPD